MFWEIVGISARDSTSYSTRSVKGSCSNTYIQPQDALLENRDLAIVLILIPSVNTNRLKFHLNR